jgi:DNA-binding CsgD family transcriptional regulator
MEGVLYITPAEMAEMLGISKSYAYKLIKQMNEELDAKGLITILAK